MIQEEIARYAEYVYGERPEVDDYYYPNESAEALTPAMTPVRTSESSPVFIDLIRKEAACGIKSSVIAT